MWSNEHDGATWMRSEPRRPAAMRIISRARSRSDRQIFRPSTTPSDNLPLSLGVMAGRNIWRSDLDRALEMIRMAAGRLGSERIQVAPSCSLLHIPVDLEAEHQLDPGLRTWLAFARQKLDETALLARAATEDSPELEEQLAENRAVLARRHRDRRACDSAVRDRTAAVRPEMFDRSSPFPVRRRKQTELRLPILPTTTIGSFPQTAEVRRARAVYRSGRMARTEYEALLRAEVERAIRFQEEIGLDVLVHIEPDLFLETDGALDFRAQQSFVLRASHFPGPANGARPADLRGLRKRADRCSGQNRETQYSLFLASDRKRTATLEHFRSDRRRATTHRWVAG